MVGKVHLSQSVDVEDTGLNGPSEDQSGSILSAQRTGTRDTRGRHVSATLRRLHIDNAQLRVRCHGEAGHG